LCSIEFSRKKTDLKKERKDDFKRRELKLALLRRIHGTNDFGVAVESLAKKGVHIFGNADRKILLGKEAEQVKFVLAEGTSFQSA